MPNAIDSLYQRVGFSFDEEPPQEEEEQLYERVGFTFPGEKPDEIPLYQRVGFTFPEEEAVAPAVIDNIVNRAPDEMPLPMPMLQGTSEDTERSMGLFDRWWRRFMEGALPVPTGDMFATPDAADRAEMVTDVFGSFMGIGVGMLPFALITGTGGAAPVGVAGGAAKVSQARQAYKLFKSGSKFLKQSQKGGAGADDVLKLAMDKFDEGAKLFAKSGLKRTDIVGSGLLGKTPGYTNWLLKIGANESRLVNALPGLRNVAGVKVAKAVDLGLRNIGMFSMYGQAKLPYLSSATERMYTLTADAASSAIFTVAGMPRVTGMKGFAKEATAGNKAAAYTLESLGLLGAGMFGGDVGAFATKPFGIEGEHITWEERLIHGLALLTLHHARAGLDKVQVKDRMNAALRGMGVDQELIAKWSSGVDKINNAGFSYLADKRPGELRNLFASKKDSENVVDLIGIFKPKVEGEKFTLVYQSLEDGKRTVVRAEDKSELTDKFFKQFDRVVPKDKVEPPIPERPPEEIRIEVDRAVKVRDSIQKALESDRTAELVLVDVFKEPGKEKPEPIVAVEMPIATEPTKSVVDPSRGLKKVEIDATTGKKTETYDESARDNLGIGKGQYNFIKIPFYNEKSTWAFDKSGARKKVGGGFDKKKVGIGEIVSMRGESWAKENKLNDKVDYMGAYDRESGMILRTYDKVGKESYIYMLPEGKGIRAILFGENGMFDIHGKFHEGGTSGIVRWKDMQVLNELNEVGLSNHVFKRMYRKGIEYVPMAKAKVRSIDIRESLKPIIEGMKNPKQWAKAFIRTVPMRLKPDKSESNKWLDAQRDSNIFYRATDPKYDTRITPESSGYANLVENIKAGKISRYAHGKRREKYDVKKLSKEQIEDNIFLHKIGGNAYQGADGKWYNDTYYSLRKSHTERRVDAEGKVSMKNYSQGFSPGLSPRLQGMRKRQGTAPSIGAKSEQYVVDMALKNELDIKKIHDKLFLESGFSKSKPFVEPHIGDHFPRRQMIVGVGKPGRGPEKSDTPIEYSSLERFKMARGVGESAISTRKLPRTLKPAPPDVKRHGAKLISTDERGVPSTRESESIFGVKKGEARAFSTEKKRDEYVQNWLSSNPESHAYLTDKLDFSKRLSRLIKENRTWSRYERRQRDVKIAEKKIDLTESEAKFFRESISPYSEGIMNKMSPNELKLYDNLLRGDAEIPSMHELSTRLPPHPHGIANKVYDNFMQSKMLLGKTMLPFTMFLRMLKSKGFNVLARMTDLHELDRQFLAATGIVLRNQVVSDYKISKKDFSKLLPFIDKKYEMFKDPAVESKLGIDKIAQIRKAYRKFQDNMFIEAVSAGVEVRKVSHTKQAYYEPLFSAYDKAGNYIEPHPSLFLLDPKKPLQKRGQQILDVISRRRKTLLSSDGEIVNVGKVQHNYVKDYATRVISEDMKTFMNRPDFSIFMAEMLVKNDSYLKSLIAGGTPKDVVFFVAKNQINDLAGYLNNELPLGTVWARTANLPPVLLADKKGRVIRMESKDLIGAKKGATVTDMYGEKHVVERVIDVYERDLNKVLDKYTNSMSQVIPTYRYFGRDGADSKTTLALLNMGVTDLGESQTARWAHGYLRAKINGAPRTPAGKVLNKFISGVAWMGLSSPFSGMKNVMLGNVQNASTVGLINFSNGWFRYLANDALSYLPGSKKTKFYKELTIRIGGLQVGVHDMLGARGWDFSPGLMKQTEHLNRYTTVATGTVVMEHAIERMAFPNEASALSKLSMGNARAAGLMKDLFGFTEKETARIIRLVREYTPEGDRTFTIKSAIFNVLQSPEALQGKWMMRALQNMHMKTQGGPSLSTLPAWLSKDWARPLSLFYRVAYNVTNNIATNVMKPLYVEGNPFPMLRYTIGATASGAAIYSLYHAILGRDMINKFEDKDWEWWNYFIRGEGLGIASNSFDEYGGILETFYPAVIRAGESVYNAVSSVVEDKKTIGQSIHDVAKRNVVVYSHALEALDNIGTKINGKTQSGRVLRKRRSESRRSQRHFEEAFFGENRKFSSDDTFLTERSPFYRAVAESFWSGDQRAKAQAYYSALMFIVHEQESKSPVGMTGRVSLVKNAESYLESIIGKQRIVSQAWKKRDKGESISRYKLYRSKLNPEETRELLELESIYQTMTINWKNALQRYRREMYFPKG